MSRGGTNRQITGIYGRSNETINFYVSYEENDRLPCFIFTQYIGSSRDWLGNNYCLTKKKESFKSIVKKDKKFCETVGKVQRYLTLNIIYYLVNIK